MHAQLVTWLCMGVTVSVGDCSRKKGRETSANAVTLRVKGGAYRPYNIRQGEATPLDRVAARL